MDMIKNHVPKILQTAFKDFAGAAKDINKSVPPVNAVAVAESKVSVIVVLPPTPDCNCTKVTVEPPSLHDAETFPYIALPASSKFIFPTNALPAALSPAAANSWLAESVDAFTVYNCEVPSDATIVIVWSLVQASVNVTVEYDRRSNQRRSGFDRREVLSGLV